MVQQGVSGFLKRLLQPRDCQVQPDAHFPGADRIDASLPWEILRA